MISIVKRACRLLRDESGPTAVEYAVMLALIIMVCIAAVNSIGTKANRTFRNLSRSMATSRR